VDLLRRRLPQAPPVKDQKAVDQHDTTDGA
jgi:hypothetical protein